MRRNAPPNRRETREGLEAELHSLSELSPLGYWMFGVDVLPIEDRGIPCAGMGPGRETFAHIPENHVAVSDLVHAARIYATAIIEVCSVTG